MLITVVIKFIAPKIDEIPAKCKLKIAKSTDPPEWKSIDDNNKIKAGGSNQKEILFNRGNAISGAPIINGTNQLPKPPIITGITKKKIIMKAWAVTITL
jgi:hypothetical protein